MSDGVGLERLSFVNGQRLAAADLRLEQAYHITVRRLLNQALFDAGIAAGLQVAVKPGDRRTVVVSPGVALDEEGREVVLLEQREVAVVGAPGEGAYLVIEFAEAPAGGGPTRLRSAPRLGWQATVPQPGSGPVVLVHAVLAADCTVRRLDPGVRTSARPERAGPATAVALRGEKDVDDRNPKDLYFHVRGHTPRKAALYLRGGRCSTLYYSELGKHRHGTQVQTDSFKTDLEHGHTLKSGRTGRGTRHRHALKVELGPNAKGVNEWDHELGWTSDLIDYEGAHTHDFRGVQTDPALAELPHHHQMAPKAVGADDEPLRSTTSLTYISGLRVAVDGADVTAQIVAQLADRDGRRDWQALGDGSDQHRLVTQGTGEIDLVRLGIDLAPGEHHVRLSVPASPEDQPPNGGKVSYNLYLE